MIFGKASPADWKLVMSDLATWLKPAGFQRSGATFVRQEQGVAIEITVERFRWNVGTMRRFQLKLRIYLPDRIDRTFSAKDWHPHFSPVFGQSAGYLWGDANFWFELPASLPNEGFSAELRRRVEGYVLPFLARCTSFDSTVAVLDEENEGRGRGDFSFFLAEAMAKSGRTEQSRKYFRKCLELAYNPEQASTIRQIAQRLGIELDE
jgi:hypothetical protein